MPAIINAHFWFMGSIYPNYIYMHILVARYKLIAHALVLWVENKIAHQ